MPYFLIYTILRFKHSMNHIVYNASIWTTIDGIEDNSMMTNISIHTKTNSIMRVQLLEFHNRLMFHIPLEEITDDKVCLNWDTLNLHLMLKRNTQHMKYEFILR